MSRDQRTVERYLERYAEPEWRVAGALGRYDNLVVVPALGEDSGFLEHLAAPGDNTLVILVINAREDERSQLRQANFDLLAAASRTAECVAPGAFHRQGLLAVDRSSDGRTLPAKQGVGLARKIGLDIGLALHHHGKLASTFLHTTDADARLPADYFHCARSLENQAVALTYPFAHDTPEGELGLAHMLYEIKLRYVVEGLRRAGSAYAHHSIGSTIAIMGTLLYSLAMNATKK